MASAAWAKLLVGASGVAGTFLLSSVVVAFSASVGGWSAGAVATLAAVLVARMTSPAQLSISLLFVGEGFLISALVARLSAAIQEHSRRLNTADARIRQLQVLERRGRTVDLACSRLEQVASDHALVILDQRGRITDWRPGAMRLYGSGAESVIGMNGGALFSPAGADDDFMRLLTDASRNGVARHRGRHQRADGTQFDAEVEVRPVAEPGCEGFTMLVGDCTREQQWQAFAASAAEAQTTLREEADVARRQLAKLQSVTDPALNALPAEQLVIALLDRLRQAVEADGVALVRTRACQRCVFPASDGLQPQGGASGLHGDGRNRDEGRILLIQNDAPRVAEMSFIGWPDTVSSLIAVPVLDGGRPAGTIEVAHSRGRRSTEWEIALIQVVAARAAGLAPDGSYADTGAVV